MVISWDGRLKICCEMRLCEVKITLWGNLTVKVGWEDGDQLFSFGAQLWSGIPYSVVFAWFAFVNHQSARWVCHQSDMWHVVGDLENDQRFQCTWFPPKQWISMIAENCGFVLHACRSQSAVNTMLSHLWHLSRLITSLGLFLCHSDQSNLFLSASPCQIWKARKMFLQCFVIWQTCWSYQKGVNRHQPGVPQNLENESGGLNGCLGR